MSSAAVEVALLCFTHLDIAALSWKGGALILNACLQTQTLNFVINVGPLSAADATRVRQLLNGLNINLGGPVIIIVIIVIPGESFPAVGKSNGRQRGRSREAFCVEECKVWTLPCRNFTWGR